MNGHRTLTMAVVVVLFLASNALAGGPWTLARGERYASIGVTFTEFEEVEAFNGMEMNVGDVEFTNTTVTFEWGHTDNLTFMAAVPYESSEHQGNPAGSIDGLTDLRLGLRYGLMQETQGAPVSIAAAFEVKTPLSDYPTQFLSSPGDHQTDLEARISLGRSRAVSDWTLYGTLEAGYRLRLDDPPDDLFGYAEVGAVTPFRLSGRLFIYDSRARGGLGLLSPEYIARAQSIGRDPFPAVGEDFTRVGAGAGYEVTDRVDVGVFWAKAIRVASSSLDRNFGFTLGYRF